MTAPARRPAVRQGRGAPVLVIGGPTASGKSALAVDVAEAMNGVVINADSVQLYRELEILSARPGPAELARAPHRLYGVLAARERCSAGRWRAMALAEIAEAESAGRLPVVVGGTGLYLKALIEGLAPVPAISPGVRAAARELHARLGAEAFHARLAERDPVMAARLRPSDTQRVLRAWEVIEATGRSLADWQAGADAEAGAGGPAPRAAFVVVTPPREALYAACGRRFDHMVDAGAVDEVRRLRALGLDPRLPAMKAVGVAELGAFLDGEIGLDEARARGRRATRQYAKRQLTWFRHQAAGAPRIGEQYSESLHSEIFPFIRRILLTAGG